MGRARLTEHLRFSYGPLEGRTACMAYYSATLVKLTNHDFPSPGWKIAIGSLNTSALAALKIYLQLAYGPSEGCTVHFTDRKQDLRLAWGTVWKAA
jgi:hypothetical protein